MTWQPPTYDPVLNLIYVATGNPNPVGATQSRKGDNLFTLFARGIESRYRENGTGTSRHRRTIATIGTVPRSLSLLMRNSAVSNGSL